jgi:hypothetical protein
METQTSLAPIATFAACRLAVGCASTPEGAAAQNKEYPIAESIFREGDLKKYPTIVYQHPIEEVRRAAVRALAFVGCKIETEEDYFIRGKRPQKLGLFVGVSEIADRKPMSGWIGIFRSSGWLASKAGTSKWSRN